MTILRCFRVGKGKRSGRFTDRFVREFVDPWRIKVDPTSAAQDPASVLNDAYGFGTPPPAMWDPHPTDSDALVKEISITEDSRDPTWWDLAAKYSTSSAEEILQADNPLLEMADWSIDTERIEFAPETDLNQDPYNNSAGDPFRPAPQDEEGILVLQYAQNIPDFNPGVIDQYLYLANSEPIFNFPIATVLCTKFRIRRSYRNGVEFFRRELEFKIDKNGDWTSRALVDVGYRYLVGGVPTAAGKNGETPATPVFLDGNGGLLNVAGGAKPVTLFFVRRGLVDFNLLRFDPIPI